MKTRYTLLLLSAALLPLALVAQGPLTPAPGPPAPLMKTLQQVEPRIDVATLAGDATSVFLISAPGSYYLSANVAAVSGKAGVAINAADVSLDLNGFAITGAAGALRGVDVRDAADGATVRNGVISGFPAGAGVGLATSAQASNVRIESLSIRNCTDGVNLAGVDGATVADVRVTSGTKSGISLGTGGVVSRCNVENMSGSSLTTLSGISAAEVSHCGVSFFTNTTGPVHGISADHCSDCTVRSLSGAGSSGTTGIDGLVTEHCSVSSVVNTGTGTVTGIFTVNVSGCHVSNIGVTGGGSPTGIRGDVVSHCSVSSVGGTNSTGLMMGIQLAVSVSDCDIAAIGNSNSIASIIGIQGTNVSHCRMRSMSTKAAITGIAADTVDHCMASGLTQSAGATTAVIGMSADNLDGCHIETLTANTTGTVAAFSTYRGAIGCTARNIANNGTSGATGYAPAANGLTLNCVGEQAGTRGVLGTDACVVRGCSIRLAGTGIGIDMPDPSPVVENNTVSGCGIGINVAGASGLVVKNRVTLCANNILVSATSQNGLAITAAGTIASSNPWANFTD